MTLETGFYHFFADAVITMFAASLLMLLVEIPFSNLDELLLTNARGGNSKMRESWKEEKKEAVK